MATWTCDICAIAMQTQDQSSHLAGRRHMTRSRQIQAATGAFCIEDRKYFELSYSEGLEPSDMAGGTGQFLSISTPTIRPDRSSRPSPSSTGSSRVTTHNSGVVKSSNPGRGTKTSDGHIIVQAGHTASLAQSVPTTPFAAYGLTAEDIAKPQDFITAHGSSYVLVWECKPCNHWMPLSSKPTHLVDVAHLERLLQSFTVSPPVVTQEQNNTTIPDIDVPQTSNWLMNSPGSSPLTSQQGNGVGAQGGVHQQALRTSKPKSAKPQQNSDKARGLAPQMRARKTRTTSSNTGSTSESAARFWTCPHCRTVLASHQKAAHRCVRPVPSTQAPTIGPLDGFFRSFPSFPYNAYATPDVSFSQLLSGLRTWHAWDRKNPNTWKLYRKEVKEKYQTALTHEFNLWFGTEDDIKFWHALCRAVKVQPPPLTCEDCRSVIRGRHVNIVDLIEWARKGETGRVQIFDTVKELSDYSYESDKIYHRDQLGAGAVLSHLLRDLRKAQYGQA